MKSLMLLTYSQDGIRWMWVRLMVVGDCLWSCLGWWCKVRKQKQGGANPRKIKKICGEYIYS